MMILTLAFAIRTSKSLIARFNMYQRRAHARFIMTPLVKVRVLLPSTRLAAVLQIWTAHRDGKIYLFFRVRLFSVIISRTNFVFASITYLFATTYESSDDMTISSLLTYLNAAMPPDKHEDFDTSEVIRAAAALQGKGEIVFVGDMIRMPPYSL